MNLPDCFLAGVPSRVVPLLALWLLTSTCRAGDFCFSMAESYYEQIYCEVQAAGRGDRLPSFPNFRNNPPITQALLLKRPAARSGIELAMPRKDKTPVAGEIPVSAAVKKSKGLPGCSLEGRDIVCDAQHFSLVGNVGNHQLAPGVLAETNKLGIPSLDEARRRGIKDAEYLPFAYRLYLKKMLEIGLGGATFSYDKFSYFYLDAAERDIGFATRLEAMFHYLKQDKRHIGVAESLPDSTEVVADRCDRVDQHMIACPAAGKNLVFVDAGA